MTTTHVHSAAAVGRHPIHAMLAPFPPVCFTLTLATDIAYWQTSNLMWQRFAEWLLLAGLVIGGLALLAGVIDYGARRVVRRQGRAWLHLLGSFLVLVLAFINSLVHAADGWTGVVPYGLALSAATVFLILVTAAIGRSVGFAPAPESRYA